MKNIKPTIIFVLLVIVVVGFLINHRQQSTTAEKPPAVKATDLQADTPSQKNSSEGVAVVSNSKQEPSKEIKKLNRLLVRERPGDREDLPFVDFSEIEVVAANDVKAATVMIEEILNHPAEHLLEFSELGHHCRGILIGHKEDGFSLAEIFANSHFAKALWDTGYCDKLTSDHSPFDVILDLARQGNKLAQYLLSGELYRASYDGRLSPKLYPLEYDDIRREAFGYLKSLSAQGFILASDNLRSEYLSNRGVLPQDRALAYFYHRVYEDQSGATGVVDFPWENDVCRSNYTVNDRCKSPAEFYRTLSEAEKARADRMLERAGY